MGKSFKSKMPEEQIKTTTQEKTAESTATSVASQEETKKKVGRKITKNLGENYTKISAYIPKELYAKMKLYRKAGGYDSMTDYIETVLKRDVEANEERYKEILGIQENI